MWWVIGYAVMALITFVLMAREYYATGERHQGVAIVVGSVSAAAWPATALFFSCVLVIDYGPGFLRATLFRGIK